MSKDLRAHVEQALERTPGSTAREIASSIRRSTPGVTRKDVNQILYGDRGKTFSMDASSWRWSLLLTAGGLPGSGSTNPRPGAKNRRSSSPAAPALTTDDLAQFQRYLASTVSVPVSPASASAENGKTSGWVPSSRSRPEASTDIRKPTPMPVRRAPVPRPDAYTLPLRGWQEDALGRWFDKGCTGIVEAVTGTGKTHLGLEAAAQNAVSGGRTTVIVPTVELQRQWRERFTTFLPRLRVSTVGGDKGGIPVSADVVIATVQTAMKSDLTFGDPDALIVADEVHRYGADKWVSVLRGTYRRRLGLTATLERADDAIDDVIRPYFGSTVTTYGFEQALGDGVVAPFRLFLLPVPLGDIERVTYDRLTRSVSDGFKRLRAAGALGPGGGPMPARLRAVAGSGGPLARVAQQTESAIRKRRDLLADADAKVDAVQALAGVVDASDGAILFTQSKDTAEKAAEALREEGVMAAALHSDIPSTERASNLRALETGRIQALAAPKLLDEGIDVPRVDLGIVMTASRSRRQMIQRLGRVLRLKADGRAVDFVIVFATDTVEDPAHGSNDGFFDLVMSVAQSSTSVDPDWLDTWEGADLAELPPAPAVEGAGMETVDA